jgi:hypothetical protein
MNNESEDNVKESTKPKVRRIVVDYPAKAEKNLKKQQSQYMKLKGKRLPLNVLAGKLLETATL